MWASDALYIGVSEWTAEQLRAGQALAKELSIRLVSNQPQYSMLRRVIEREVVPAARELGVSQIVCSPIAHGVLTGKYQPGAEPPAGPRATDDEAGADMISRFLNSAMLSGGQQLQPIAADLGLTMAQLAVAWAPCRSPGAPALPPAPHGLPWLASYKPVQHSVCDGDKEPR